MRRIAVLTSGGDAPGMNAAVRAIVRIGLSRGLEVYGVRHGFAGLIADEVEQLTGGSVAGIQQLGGTILGTDRSEEFRTEPGRAKGIANLTARGIEALVVIGGDGSQIGALEIMRQGYPTVGIPSSIDNDVPGSDITIGADTALNIALEAIRHLHVATSSRRRAFLVEVMGRKSGYLALMAGLAAGADIVVIPEVVMEPEEVAHKLRGIFSRGKQQALAVIAEGAKYNANDIARYCRQQREQLGFEVRETTLGHVQAGAAPRIFDCLLAINCSAAAIESLARGEAGVMQVLRRGEVMAAPLEEAAGTHKLDLRAYDLAGILAGQ